MTKFGDQWDVQAADLKSLSKAAPMSKEEHAKILRQRVDARRRVEDIHEDKQTTASLWGN